MNAVLLKLAIISQYLALDFNINSYSYSIITYYVLILFDMHHIEIQKGNIIKYIKNGFTLSSLVLIYHSQYGMKHKETRQTVFCRT